MPLDLQISYLNSDQIQPGDICLKYGDGSGISKAISFGQNLMQGDLDSGNTNIVHAGILCDDENIVEAQGDGICINNLHSTNKKYGYEVYRCLLTNIAQGAATASTIVLDAHKASQNAKYSLAGAVRSLFSTKKGANKSAIDVTIDRLTKGKKRDFFCSQFVVYCYQLAAEQNGLAAQNMFDLSDTAYSPTKLKDSLFKSSYFFKAGMLRPGIR